MQSPGTVETIDRNRFGWVAGVGVEYAFTPNWTARWSTCSPSRRHNLHLPPRRTRDSDGREGVSQFRVGVNYKFNFGGGVIAARN